MHDTIHIIEDALATAKLPVVLSSFQKDSLLLTWLVRQIAPDTPVLWFKDRSNPFADRVIMEWGLKVYSYPPADRYLIANDNSPAMLVDEYSVGSKRLPVLRDVVGGNTCDLERLSPARTPTFPYPWDVTFFGFKAADASEHFATGRAVLPQRFALGHTTMIAPLYDWSDSDVLTAITDHAIPYEPTDDSLRACGNCMDSLANWDGTASLAAFRLRYGFKAH